MGVILLLAVAKENGVEYRCDNANSDARTAQIVADRTIREDARWRRLRLLTS